MMASKNYTSGIVLCLFLLILKASSLELHANRACIIGGGFAGLATARYMKQYGVNFTLFEASRHIGGTWRFDPHVGIDEDGLPLFTSMYKNLRTNTPRQTMEFAGFPFPDDTPSYPSGPCYYKYLQYFAKHFDLLKNIQVRSLVTSVKWVDDHWELTYYNSESKQSRTETCDFVVVASGQYLLPSWPKIEGLETFRGNMIHSHDYKDPEDYRNHRVLVVGAGASGLDLATHLSNVTSKLVHSHHAMFNQPHFGDTYVRKPDIMAFTATGAIFQDGTFEELDDVIFCTGYRYNHPFLDSSTGVTATDKFILPLYQQVVNIKHPSMTFVGISKRIINRVLDAQAEYSAALAAGKFEIPSQEEMLNIWLSHVYNIQTKGMKIVDVNVIGNDMDQYFGNLTQEAGVVRAPLVLSEMRDFNAVNRLEDLLNYRDYDYKIMDDSHFERKYNPRKVLPCPIDDL
ncbi:senecionine N-oxygenase-like isoform X2 [Manduca sexta]|uniref:senecionine N-oxygenase-like isoform X2 n=1 Tax=Manduca sexta TaxID=7130 RepID=UPI00188FAD5D|nr:senecionine N-oxygenase-like isoform X2 [Manduca sexta]